MPDLILPVMDALILTIGDEILNGTTIDTNSAWIGRELALIGVSVKEIRSVSDRHEHILSTLHDIFSKYRLILVTGGLGPTNDDITKKTLCAFFGSELVFHENIYKRLQSAFASRGIVFTENNGSQAMLPADCEILPNALGTAQGMWFEKNGSVLISMPGVPFEMKGLMNDIILQKIKKQFTLPVIVNRYIMTSGISESLLADTIAPVENKLPAYISLAYLPAPGIVKLRLTAKGNNEDELKKEVEIYASEIISLVKESVFGSDGELPEEVIGKKLKMLHATLATAESCTGGKIAAKITSIPGSSDYYVGSVVAYANEIKNSVLGVSSETLENFGAVSKETVDAMLTGALKVFRSDFAVAVSGVAGPSGGTDEKPVGTVYIGVADRKERVVKKYFFNKNREMNIEYAAVFAIHELMMLLDRRLADPL